MTESDAPPPEQMWDAAEQSRFQDDEAGDLLGQEAPGSLPPEHWTPRALMSKEGTELERLQRAWPEVVGKCVIVQPLLKAFLRDSWPTAISELRLNIGIDPEFASELELVRQHERGVLGRLFERFLGRKVQLVFEAMTEKVTWSHHKPDDSAPDDDQPFDIATAGISRQAWQKNEAVRRILESFHGQIIDIQT